MKRLCLIALAAALLVQGCIKKDDFNFKNIVYTNWTPDWALPFISSTLTMQNMLNGNTLITTDPSSGLLTLNYSGTPYTFSASQFISIPDQHYTSPSFTLTNPISGLAFGATVSDSNTLSFNYSDPAGDQLRHLGLKGGTIHVGITSTYNQNVSVQVVFPNIVNGGTPLTISLGITYPSTSGDAYADLTGYTLDLSNGGILMNYMAYKVYYTLTGTGQPIGPSNSLSVALDMTGLQFKFLDGILGNYTLPFPDDTIKIGVMNKALAANIRLQNPQLHIQFANSFGARVGLNLDSIYAIAPSGGMDTIVLPGMTILGDSILGQVPAQSIYTVDSTNSNIRNLLNPMPSYVVFNGHVSLNPGSTSLYTFVTDTSTISFTVNAVLPACFQIIQLALQDTIKLQMPPDTALLTKAQFAVQVSNAFPVYAQVQLYFTDSNYVILDSLVTPSSSLIPPAIVNGYGIVSDSTSQTTNFVYEHARYMAIASRVRHGLVRGNLLTSGSGNVQLHATDHLSVKSAFRFTLNYSL
jgi:hypothetical protein